MADVLDLPKCCCTVEALFSSTNLLSLLPEIASNAVFCRTRPNIGSMCFESNVYLHTVSCNVKFTNPRGAAKQLSSKLTTMYSGWWWRSDKSTPCIPNGVPQSGSCRGSFVASKGCIHREFGFRFSPAVQLTPIIQKILEVQTYSFQLGFEPSETIYRHAKDAKELLSCNMSNFSWNVLLHSCQEYGFA